MVCVSRTFTAVKTFRVMEFLLLFLFLLLLVVSWLLLGAGWVTHTHAFLAGSWVTGERRGR